MLLNPITKLCDFNMVKCDYEIFCHSLFILSLIVDCIFYKDKVSFNKMGEFPSNFSQK